MQHAAWSSWNMETSKVQGLKAWIVEVYSVYLHPPSMFKLLAEIASQTSSFKPTHIVKGCLCSCALADFHSAEEVCSLRSNEHYRQSG